jgi:hypothetical protein
MKKSDSNLPKEAEKTEDKVTPLRCLLGAVIAGSLATGVYHLTQAIAKTFAAKPITSTNQLFVNISSMVRTLVVGVSSLATFIFGFIAIGLVLLAMQLLIQEVKQKYFPPSDA